MNCHSCGLKMHYHEERCAGCGVCRKCDFSGPQPRSAKATGTKGVVVCRKCENEFLDFPEDA